MIVFPLTAALLSLACALLVAWDGVRRPKPDKGAWAIAFTLFALAAGAEVTGAVVGWSPLLARVYYLAGAVLVVGYLGLGELYLLAEWRIRAVAPGAALLVTALAVTLVVNAPIATARLASDGWSAIERGPALIALTITLNGLGTLVVVGGALISAYRFWRHGGHRHRLIGCLLIAVGTLIVAAGGTLTRFGHREYLYLAMAVGVAVIFAGYLEARRTTKGIANVAVDSAATLDHPDMSPIAPPAGGGLVLLSVRSPGSGIPLAAVVEVDPAIAYLERQALPLAETALIAWCREWSVELPISDRLEREQAHRVWALRLRLSPTGQTTFDTLSITARLHLAEVYHEVLAPGVAAWDASRQPTSGTA